MSSYFFFIRGADYEFPQKKSHKQMFDNDMIFEVHLDVAVK